MPADDPPALFILWRRDRLPRARWKRVGTFASRAEAVDMTHGGADFWIGEIRRADLAGSNPEPGATGYDGIR